MVPAPRTDLSTRRVDEEIVILDRASGQVHRLNPTATVIWDYCDGANTIPDIAARIAATYERPLDEAIADVSRTVGDFAQLGLLQAGADGRGDGTA